MSQAFRKLTSSISQKTFFFYWRSISKKHGGNTISAEERSIYKVIPFLKDDVTRQKEKIISNRANQLRIFIESERGCTK